MTKYHHLSLEEREKLYAWKLQGISLREIGQRLGRSHTTLGRELKRNAKYGSQYIPCKANAKAVKRGVNQRYQAPLKSPLIFLYIRKRLRRKWSPETIEVRLPIDFPGESITDFCHAYHSWEKGTVENTIGRLRRYLPKGLSLDTISDDYIKRIEEEMNNTPRKCLGFLTPYEKKNQILKRNRV